QDSTVRAILQDPGRHTAIENKRMIEEKFKGINNSFFLYNPTVYFTLLDFQGSVYTSFQPKEKLSYETIIAGPSFQETIKRGAPYHWVPNDENYVFQDWSTSPSLLSLYSQLRDRNHTPFGL